MEVGERERVEKGGSSSGSEQGMVAMAVIGARSSHCRRWRHLPLLHRHTLIAYNKIFFFSFFGDNSPFLEIFFNKCYLLHITQVPGDFRFFLFILNFYKFFFNFLN
jgi:hypothetical protein